MKFMKKDFVRKDFFSLKERFNMMMTAMICFLNGVLGLKDKNGWFVKELVGGTAADTRKWIHFLNGERIERVWENCSVWKKIKEIAGDNEGKGNVRKGDVWKENVRKGDVWKENVRKGNVWGRNIGGGSSLIKWSVLEKWSTLVERVLNRTRVDWLVLEEGCEKRIFCMSGILCRGSPPGERLLEKSPAVKNRALEVRN